MSMLHLPGPSQSSGGVQSMIDLYDSEILAIEKVLDQLNAEDVGKRKQVDSVDHKIEDMFRRIGLKVSVMWYTAADRRGQEVDGVFIPEVTIQDRIDRHEFDHDRQVHQVTNDLLELGDKGVIKTTKAPEKKFL